MNILQLILVFGIYNIIMSLVLNTDNFLSAMVFKVIPFFMGATLSIYALKELNIL